MPEATPPGHQGLVRAGLKAPRVGAVAGILFSLLLLASLALLRSAVPANPAAGAEWLPSNEKTVSLALNLLPFAGVAFLWLIGVLRDRIGDLEDRFFASVFLGSGLLFLGMIFVSSALAGGLLTTWDSMHGTLVDSGVYRFARTTSFQLVNVYGMRMAAVFMISTSTIALRTGIFPRWIALLGYGIAVLLLAGSGRISWVPMAFPAWTLLVSAQILFSNLRRPRGSVPPSIVLAVLVVGALPVSAQMPFAPFGARQVALGGASVGLGDDPASFVDNPALLPNDRKGGAVAYGEVATSGNGFVPLLEGVTGKDPVALASPGSPDADAVRSRLVALSAPGTSVLGDGRSAITTVVGGWGILVGRTEWSAAITRADLVRVEAGSDPATSFAFNDSVVAFRALSVQEYAVSRALPLLDGHLVLGATGRYTRGTTGIKEESAFVTDIGRLSSFARRGTSGIERTKSRWSYDVGAVMNIGVLRLGGVYKGVNRPQYPFNDDVAPEEDRGASVVTGQQGRVGASVLIKGLKMRIAADLDLTKNETLAEGTLSRNAGGGVELAFGGVDLRGGAMVNLESPDEEWTYTFGLGFGSPKARLDAAAVYRSADGAYGGVLTARVGF